MLDCKGLTWYKAALNTFSEVVQATTFALLNQSKQAMDMPGILTPGVRTDPIPFLSFDLPRPPLPERPAPRGLRFPGNPDPRPCTKHSQKLSQD